MTRLFAQTKTAVATFSGASRAIRIGVIFTLVAAAAIAAASLRPAMAAQAAAGDTFVYRVVDGYSSEPRGQISYRVDSADAGRVVMSVFTERSGSKLAATEIYTPDGNWLRHPVVNRDRGVDYEFSQAYPNYDMPLDNGKQWSGRVNAVNPATGLLRSVRVDAEVIGTERVRVPAGEFDTIKIRRTVYAGDGEYRLGETTIFETDWFAPALGRSVRVARKSGYIDTSRGRENRAVRGDWDIYELVSAPTAK
jgi:hypothetical protein